MKRADRNASPDAEQVSFSNPSIPSSAVNESAICAQVSLTPWTVAQLPGTVAVNCPEIFVSCE